MARLNLTLDEDTFKRGIDVIQAVCDGLAFEGVRGGVHPHIADD